MISDLTVAYMIMVLLTFVGSAIFSRTFCSLTARYPVKQYTDSCLSNCILGGVILECSMLRGKRIPALELMKLIAIAFIIFSSALPYGESFGGGTVFIDLKQTDFSFEHILLTWMRYCGQIGDTLFIAVSAWFLSGSLKCKANKVIHIIFDTWMISFIGLLIASFFLDMSIPDVLHALFPIKYNVNWFVGCYLLYYLIHPMLNKAVNGFGKREFLVLTSALFIMYSVVSTIEKSYYYTNLVGFISLHYFILYYKKYIYQRKINIHAPLILVCASVGIFCWICLLNVLGEYLPPLSDNNLFGCVFMNPLIVFIGIALLDIQTHCKKCNLSRIARITDM